MIRGAAFLIVFSLALGQGPAWADRDDPDALIAQGLKAMRKGDYQAALDAFRSAHHARPTTRSHAEIGLAEQALHRWLEAEADLARALVEEEDEWLKEHRSLLDKALADVRSHLGTLTVESGPHGAEVKINGETRGVLPLPQPRASGHGAGRNSCARTTALADRGPDQAQRDHASGAHLRAARPTSRDACRSRRTSRKT